MKKLKGKRAKEKKSILEKNWVDASKWPVLWHSTDNKEGNIILRKKIKAGKEKE